MMSKITFEINRGISSKEYTEAMQLAHQAGFRMDERQPREVAKLTQPAKTPNCRKISSSSGSGSCQSQSTLSQNPVTLRL